ncbi:hypothetical protein G6F40_017070 [Rhizopus arrhizus]|nr:hypothetical protein G6F40_017070 [Rhizopus arrhizus]
MPVVWWVPAPEHLLEHDIRVRFATRRPQGLFIVDPGVHDDLRLRVIPEEQPAPPSDLGPSPVAVGRYQGVALAVLVACRFA